ncbi:unnamed protein product [Ectocarpus sp. 13 AM-2016]
MAMVARSLGPVQTAVLRRTRLGDGSLLLPASRTIASISGRINKASPKPSRSLSRRNTYSTSAARGTAPVATMQPIKGPPCVLRSSGDVSGNSATCIRRNLHCNSGRAVATADWLRPPVGAVLLGQGDASRAGGMPSSGAVNQISTGGHGVVFLQAAGLRTMSRVFAPATGDAAGKKPGGEAASPSQPGSSNGHGNKTPPSPSEIRPPAGSGGRGGSNTMDPPAGKPNNPQAAVKATGSIGDNERTVKGGNPDLREREGTFVEMRDRIRHARADASEDAKDWMRDKRDDMNTMKETLRDARRDLRNARRDGTLGAQLSDQAKESSSRLQDLWRKYGAVGIGTYFGIYFGSIAIFYGIYDYGVLTNLPSEGTAVIEHMQEWMKNAPEWAQGYSDRLFGAMVEDHRARSFVLAWATCKVLEPVRLLGAIAMTPRMARALGRAPAKVSDADEDEGSDADDGGGGSRKGGSTR